MMTRNGTDRPHPCSAAGSDTFVCRNATSLSSTPMSRPPASVSQYERNAPTSAAAMPGTTSSARFVTLSPLTLTTQDRGDDGEAASEPPVRGGNDVG